MAMTDLTQPPDSDDALSRLNLRFGKVDALFAALPGLGEDIGAEPGPVPCLVLMRDLMQGPTPEDAVTLAAFALAHRHAIWWGHECLKSLPELLTAEDRDMLALCEQWCAAPDEPQRYAALDAGLAAPKKGPGVWLALATGWSGGSMVPPDQTVVPVPDIVMPRALSAAVLSMLARVPQVGRRRALEHFVGMADVLARSV